MSSLSVFKRPSNVDLYNKIIDVINGQVQAEEIQQFLQEAPILEAAQMYVEGFENQDYINYNRWSQRVSARLQEMDEKSRCDVFEVLMSVFHALSQYRYNPNDYEYFYATWNIPGFKEYAQDVIKNSPQGQLQSQEILGCLIERFGEYFGNQKIIHNTDFTDQWEQIASIAHSLNVDLRSVTEKLSQRGRFSAKAVMGLYEYFNWDPNALCSTAMDSVFQDGSKDDVQKMVDKLPLEMITQNNGSLLYRILRGYDLLRETPHTEHAMAGIPVLLKHIDYLQCLKSRFHDVRPTERFEVAANLAPFLSADEQEKLFELLEDSLARTKNKREIKELKECTGNKAEDFKRLWSESNLRKKMKEETSHIQKTATRKM